jgi:hypothetical protein
LGNGIWRQLYFFEQSLHPICSVSPLPQLKHLAVERLTALHAGQSQFAALPKAGNKPLHKHMPETLMKSLRVKSTMSLLF